MVYLKRGVILVAALLAVVSVAPKHAECSVVAYINHGSGNVDYLNSYGHAVTYFNNPVGLELSDLSGYDAIMITSNYPFSQSSNIGNVAADFADSGRGVVLTEFDFQGGWELGGRIMTPGYSPFTVSSGYYYYPDTLGSVFEPGCEIFNGVDPTQVRTNYQADVGIDPGANLVADWNNTGRHAIGYRTLLDSRVVALNLFPSHASSTDSKRLIANAITFSTLGGDVVPEPSTLAIWGILGGLGLIVARRRRKQVA